MILLYADFARVLSIVVVVLYLALVYIAARRAQYRGRSVRRTELVTVHARKVEGPVLTVLLLAAIGVAFAAAFIGQVEYARVAGLAVAGIRGALLILGLWLAAWYWQVRETWQ